MLRQQASARRLAAEPVARGLRRPGRDRPPRLHRRLRGRRSTARTSSPRRSRRDGDDYSAIMVKALADRLAEAFAEWLHEQSRRAWYAPDEQLASRGARRRALPRDPAGLRVSGVPRPLAEARRCSTCSARSEPGSTLTETYASLPAASVSGMYLGHPAARYFAVGRDRPRPGRGLRRAQGRGARARRALAPPEPRVRPALIEPRRRFSGVQCGYARSGPPRRRRGAGRARRRHRGGRRAEEGADEGRPDDSPFGGAQTGRSRVRLHVGGARQGPAPAESGAVRPPRRGRPDGHGRRRIARLPSEPDRRVRHGRLDG